MFIQINGYATITLNFILLLIALGWSTNKPLLRTVRELSCSVFSADRTVGTNLSTLTEPICPVHKYEAEVVCADPLLIYIHDFLSSSEIDSLLKTDVSFSQSLITNDVGKKRQSTWRTSETAFLPKSLHIVQCILQRTRHIMDAIETWRGHHLDFQTPQLVRYAPGQQFKLHADWFAEAQPYHNDGTLQGNPSWNRPASLFAILEDHFTGGGTWFPFLLEAIVNEPKSKMWYRHEEKGLVFRPKAGDALFWVNLFLNGTGDERTKHAGLPVESGLKTGMNIWPRIYYNNPAVGTTE